MNILLWVLQVLLAAAYHYPSPTIRPKGRPTANGGAFVAWSCSFSVLLAHGILFLNPPAEMVQTMNESIRPALRLFIGAAEVLAALGLVLPGITRIQPWLTPLAAAGLMIVMINATVLHTVRAETSSALTTAVLLILVTFVAYMRWKVKPLGSKVAVKMVTDQA